MGGEGVILRDARTRPLGWSACRRLGHRWGPDGRCGCCMALLVEAPARPTDGDPTVPPSAVAGLRARGWW